MFSLRQPIIAHAPSQAAISKALSQHGVHIYFDEPHTKKNQRFDTPLANMESTKSTSLTWTSLFRAKGGNASFALGLSRRPVTVELEYGIAGAITYYAARRDSAKTWVQQDFFNEPLRKGEYAVLTTHCEYPQGGKVKDIKHSFQRLTLTHITQGNTAVIQGQYVASNKKYKGPRRPKLKLER